MRRSLPLALLAALAAAATTPSAGVADDYVGSPYTMDPGAYHIALNNLTLAKRLRWYSGYGYDTPAPLKKPLPKPARSVTLAFRVTPGLNTPREMARSFPAGRRAQVEPILRRLLATMRPVEKQFGQPKRDLATAVAFFIGATHESATGKPFPTKYAVPLIRQVRTKLKADRAIARATDAAKQRMYERVAIAGMSIAVANEALAKQPDPVLAANVQMVSANAFRRLVGVDASQVTFTAKGMALASG